MILPTQKKKQFYQNTLIDLKCKRRQMQRRSYLFVKFQTWLLKKHVQKKKQYKRRIILLSIFEYGIIFVIKYYILLVFIICNYFCLKITL